MSMVTTTFSNTSLEISKNIMITAGAAYKIFEKEYPNIISTRSGDLLIDKRMRYEGPGGLPEQAEDASASTTAFREGYVETTNLKLYSYDMPVSWHLRFFATKNSNFTNQMGQFLARSAAIRYETTGMSPINNGFTTGVYAGGDGASYFSASHTFKTGDSYSNLLTAADLSKTTLEAALKTIANAKMENSIPAMLKVNQITVAYENIFTLPELLKSSLDPESANNTYNVFKDFGLSKFLSHYQSDTDQWTVDTNQKSREMIIAQKPVLDRYMNDTKKQLVVSMHTSIGSGFYDQVNSYSNQGA